MAREDSQVFYCHTLSLVYIEVDGIINDIVCSVLYLTHCWYIQYLVMKWFNEFVEDARQEEEGLHAVLVKLAGLYGVWCLEKHSGLLYQGRDSLIDQEYVMLCVDCIECTGGYFSNPGDLQIVKDSILHFCQEVCILLMVQLICCICLVKR